MDNKKSDESVFEKNYHAYLNQVFSNISNIPAGKLGISINNNEINLPLLNTTCHISEKGIFDASGNRPSYDICIILFKYLLTDRNSYPQEKKWCSYRDLKDSNPLIHYFKTNAEDPFIKKFSGNVDLLKKSCISIGGISAKEKFNRDVSMKFNILPKVPVLLLFNDEDEEFPATCSMLFEKRAENFLDAECLAMVGRFLFISVAEVAEI